MRSHSRGMLQRHLIVAAAALIVVASLALALVLVPGISSLRALEAGPCGRATIFDCVPSPVAASADAKLLVGLPHTVMRSSLSSSRGPRSVPTVSEPHQGDPRWVMHTGLHAEVKRKMHTAGVPLLPDVLKPERLHSRPERATPAVPRAPGVQRKSALTKQTDAGEKPQHGGHCRR